MQEDLAHVHDKSFVCMYGRELHAGVAADEFAPLVQLMSAADFASCRSLVLTGHSLGGGCASLFAVLANDPSDPLALGVVVDELHAFGPTPVFHGASSSDLRCGQRPDGSFRGGIYRTLRTREDGVEVQDRAFQLAVEHDYHYPKADLISLRPGKAQRPMIVDSGRCHRTKHICALPLDETLFPLHSPMHYVNWL